MILQLITCIFIGRRFSQLAFDNNRNRWGSAILSGIGCFVLQYVFAVAAQLLLFGLSDSPMGSTIVASLIGIGLGVGIMLLIYKALERSWEGNPKDGKSSDLLDS